MRYLAVIPARGGSKRIPNKNLITLAGKPLIQHTIEAAILSKKIEKIIVSTDDIQILNYCKKFNIPEVSLRPKELSRDDSPMTDVFKHILDLNIKFDNLVLLQPTSPFRNSKHIESAIDLFESENADTLTSVINSENHPYYQWTIKGQKFKPFFSIEHQSIPRQNLPPALIENGAIYIINKKLVKEGKIYGEIIIPFEMDNISSIDIDTTDDLLWAEFIFTKSNK
jgi:CMP-N-acetylneuraminic acid synthetase